MMRYWMHTISRAHVEIGVQGGFMQADHGKNTRIRKLEKGDWIVFFSSCTEFCCGETLQSFTAIGCIDDNEPYQVEINPNFHPWRRIKVQFFESQESSICPLIEGLRFITNKNQWGYILFAEVYLK